ncbi:zwei Ig domain protein zig-8-like, partial [Diaphorina citri]|uniref:Zwei Ig domain protein zig-8-like n=1 Tax=Diaphorina citri TaxID=121845 RepID=A0A3Q0JB35_DIACI
MAQKSPEIPDYLDMEIEGEGDGVPRFLKDLMNISIPIGKEIVLSCAVVQLGNHKVGWIRLDDQTVLSLGDRIVTNNHRIKISTYQNRHFQLHIHQAAKSDAGCYMCQVNTVVMMKQIGCVDIKTTPDIDNENSPSDVAVAEYDNATLYCVATGNPMPSIVWSRDGNREVIIKSPNSSDIER